MSNVLIKKLVDMCVLKNFDILETWDFVNAFDPTPLSVVADAWYAIKASK